MTLTGTPAPSTSVVNINFLSTAFSSCGGCSNNTYPYSFTAGSGDTTAALLVGDVATNINSNATLSAAGVTASASGAVISISAPLPVGVVGGLIKAR